MTCKTPQPNPDIKTLFVDHICEPSTGALTRPPVNNHLTGTTQTGGTLFRPIPLNAVTAGSAQTGGTLFRPIALNAVRHRFY